MLINLLIDSNSRAQLLKAEYTYISLPGHIQVVTSVVFTEDTLVTHWKCGELWYSGSTCLSSPSVALTMSVLFWPLVYLTVEQERRFDYLQVWLNLFLCVCMTITICAYSEANSFLGRTNKMWLKGELCASCFYWQLLNYNKEMKISTQHSNWLLVPLWFYRKLDNVIFVQSSFPPVELVEITSREVSW